MEKMFPLLSFFSRFKSVGSHDIRGRVSGQGGHCRLWYVIFNVTCEPASLGKKKGHGTFPHHLLFYQQPYSCSSWRGRKKREKFSLPRHKNPGTEYVSPSFFFASSARSCDQFYAQLKYQKVSVPFVSLDGIWTLIFGKKMHGVLYSDVASSNSP